MTNAAPSRPRRARSRFVTTALGAATGVALTAGLVVTTAGAVASAAPDGVSVSHVDTVGFPYVDLVVSGVPGFGLGPVPTVRITQDGAPLRTTSTWALSAGNPLAVVVDAPSSRLEQAQGLVAELVQEMPPSVPIALPSVPGGAARPSLDRDGLMTALSHQAAHRATTVPSGLTAAESAGVQHVLVVTTCTGPAPQPAPAGVSVDVLGIGPGCTGRWLSLPGSGAGQFTRTPTFDAGLASLDAMVARWRSSVLAVTQVLTRDPLAVSVGATRVAVPLPAGSASAPAAAPSTTAAAPRSDAGSTGRRTALAVGLVLLVLAGLLALVWWRRHRAAVRAAVIEASSPAAGPQTVEPREVAAVSEAAATPEADGRAGADEAPAPAAYFPPAMRPPAPALSPAHPARPARPASPAGPQIDHVRRPVARPPVVIDLREPRPVDDDRAAPDTRPRQPQMAVAREQLTGHSEVTPPAVVARVQSIEEPPAVAQQTPTPCPAPTSRPRRRPSRWSRPGGSRPTTRST